MELQVTQENFSKALSDVGRVASAKTGLPILNNILLRTDGKRLLVAATNLEIAATQYLGAKISSPGAITVPARLITEFVHNLPKDTVTLSVKDNLLHVSSGTYNSIINGVVDEEFPELPVINEKTAVIYTLAVDEFKQAINQTIITASNDATRPVLTGVYWHSHEGSLYLAATDGYRLSERQLIPVQTDIAAIVPVATLQEVLRTIDDTITEIEVLFDETQVRFRLQDAEITSRLIDGNFPDYRQLIPASTSSTAMVASGEFSRITKIASLFARESGGSITVTSDADAKQLSIHTVASELGENTSAIDATIEGDTASVSLNSRYLAEALGAINSETVSFGFSGKLAPCVLIPAEKTPVYKHIIMPLKS